MFNLSILLCLATVCVSLPYLTILTQICNYNSKKRRRREYILLILIIPLNNFVRRVMPADIVIIIPMEHIFPISYSCWSTYWVHAESYTNLLHLYTNNIDMCVHTVHSNTLIRVHHLVVWIMFSSAESFLEEC